MIPISVNEKIIQSCFSKIREKNIKSLAITSSVGKEGVSSFAYTLARRTAASGLKVLLLDLNINHLSQLKHLALKEEEWSMNQIQDKKAIQQLGKTNLSLLSAPQKRSQDFGLNDPIFLKHFIDKLLKDFDVIIADTPPVVSKHQKLHTEIICNAFQETILMVKSASTTETQIKKAYALLKQHQVYLAGVIMNDFQNLSLQEELLRICKKYQKICPPMFDFMRKIIKKIDFFSLKI